MAIKSYLFNLSHNQEVIIMSISNAQNSMVALNKVYAQNHGKKLNGDGLATYLKLSTSSAAAGKDYNRDYHAVWDQMLDNDNIKGNTISLERFYANEDKLMFQSLNTDVYSYDTKAEKLSRLTEEQFIQQVSDKNPYTSDLFFGDDSYVLKSYTLNGEEEFKNLGDRQFVTERMNLQTGRGRSIFNKAIWEYGAKNNNKVDFAKIFGKESNVMFNKSPKNGKQEMLIEQDNKFYLATCDSDNPSSIQLKEVSSFGVLDKDMLNKGYKSTNFKMEDGYLKYDVSDSSSKIISKGLICDDLSKANVLTKALSAATGNVVNGNSNSNSNKPNAKPVVTSPVTSGNNNVDPHVVTDKNPSKKHDVDKVLPNKDKQISGNAKDRISETGLNAKDRISETRLNAKDRISETRLSAKDRISEARAKAQEMINAARSKAKSNSISTGKKSGSSSAGTAKASASATASGGSRVIAYASASSGKTISSNSSSSGSKYYYPGSSSKTSSSRSSSGSSKYYYPSSSSKKLSSRSLSGGSKYYHPGSSSKTSSSRSSTSGSSKYHYPSSSSKTSSSRSSSGSSKYYYPGSSSKTSSSRSSSGGSKYYIKK